MGVDVTAIAKHNLNTTNIEALAYDIATRLNANIAYGFWATKVSQLVNPKHKDGFIELGIASPPEEVNETYALIHDNYEEHIVYKTFGKNFFYTKAYWKACDYDEIPDENFILHHLSQAIFPIYNLTLKDDGEYEYFHIYKHLFENSKAYFNRWYGICRFFKEYSLNEIYTSAYYLKFRQDLTYYAKKFGGSTVYCVPDQSHNLDIGQGQESEMTWQEFTAYVKKHTEEHQINVSQFFTDETYAKQIQLKTDKILSFKDDFSDLK